MRGWLGAIVVVGLVAAGCSGDDDTDKGEEPVAAESEDVEPDDAEPGDVDVEVAFLEETFVDPSRTTSASDFAPGADTRTIETRIAYPTPLEDEAPLIVLAHGMWGSTSRFTDLMTAWAEAGYVVAAPTFPRSTEDQPGGQEASDVNDIANQPADVSFVINEVLRLAEEDTDSDLYGHIDEARIGVAGHSLGGVTAYGAVFNTCCRDDRIVAGIYMAGPRDMLGPLMGGTFEPRDVPALLIVADGDFVYESSRDAYPTLAAPKWLVTLHGGGAERHASPFEDTPDDADQIVFDTTVAFWDLQLNEDADALDRLEAAAQPDDGAATLQSE